MPDGEYLDYKMIEVWMVKAPIAASEPGQSCGNQRMVMNDEGPQSRAGAGSRMKRFIYRLIAIYRLIIDAARFVLQEATEGLLRLCISPSIVYLKQYCLTCLTGIYIYADTL